MASIKGYRRADGTWVKPHSRMYNRLPKKARRAMNAVKEEGRYYKGTYRDDMLGEGYKRKSRTLRKVRLKRAEANQKRILRQKQAKATRHARRQKRRY